MMSARVSSVGRGFQHMTPAPLFRTRLTLGRNNKPYDVAKDGKRFLIPVGESPGEPPLTMWTNWTARLPR